MDASSIHEEMRATEFISEDAEVKLRKASREALPHVIKYDGIDQYYGYYRLGIAMAGSPDQGTPTAGPAKNTPTLYPYSEADEEIVNKAVKNQGLKGKTLVKKGVSKELDSIYTVSPVAQWMN
jgi:hypothetical protein